LVHDDAQMLLTFIRDFQGLSNFFFHTQCDKTVLEATEQKEIIISECGD
jgi:hypothetical protein